MKQFLKVVIWILILGVIGFGVYTILPEYPKNFVKGVVQPIVDSQASARIEQIQNLTNKDLNGATYKAILETNTGISSWVYEKGADAVEYVTFYGKGASINLKKWTDYNGLLSTSCSVKMVFRIEGNNVEIIPYIDGTKMYIEGGNYAESNKEIKKDIFKQLYTGVIEE